MSEKFRKELAEILNEIESLLNFKNKKYGSSFDRGISVFGTGDKIQALGVRIDDKLSRIKEGHGNDKDEDTINDLIGYLILYKMLIKESDR